MNAKENKKYELIVRIGNTLPEDPALVGMFVELAAIDFTTAIEMWEYMMNLYATDLSKVDIALNLERGIYAAFSAKSDARLRQHLGESPPLLKSIYSSSATAATEGNLAYLVSLVLNSKIDAAGEVFRLISVNKNSNLDYGERMKSIIDEIFRTYCAAKGVAVPSLNRKQTMLLLEYALKIKGPNKNLLVQRVKELG